MDTDKQKQLIRAGRFRANNGAVMRVLNILSHTFHPLKDIRYALPDISQGELVESLDYLHEAGYIHIRSIEHRTASTLADDPFDNLEAKATANGRKLLEYALTDPCVEI